MDRLLTWMEQPFRRRRVALRHALLVVVFIVAAIVIVETAAHGVQDNVLTILSGGICIAALLRLWVSTRRVPAKRRRL